MNSLDQLEDALERAGHQPRFLAGSTVTDADRLEANMAAIDIELDAPKPRLLARSLRRLGVGDRIVPLVTATPALRASWIGSVVVALLFALNAASSSAASGTERIVVFLTIAPLVPLLGVALAFGPAVDPTHEVAVAAPMDGFRLFLVRATTVVSAGTFVLLIGSLLAPAGGAARIGWLLPSLAATALTMALSTRFDPRFAAGGVGAAWILLVVIVSQASTPAAMFGPPTQLLSLAVAVAGAGAFVRERRHLDELSTRGDK